MRVCIDARIPDDRSGGVQQLILGLASGLGALTDGDEDYIFVTYSGRDEWLRAAVTGRCRIEAVAMPTISPGRLRQKLKAYPLLTWWMQKIYRGARMALGRVRPAPSSGVFEQLRADIVHFPLQAAELVELPNIYHPHDLQHIHYPEYFTVYERHLRNLTYRAYTRNATAIAVASTWVKQDLIENLGCPAEKIFVVPLAPPNTTASYNEVSAQNSLSLPEAFFFYPAQTWPHKNHRVLIDALARLHARGHQHINLVFTGAQNSHRRILDQQIARLEMGHFVHFLGFVTPAQLNHIYSNCIGCVVPSLFEAGSFPAWEAFFAGAPVAVARITSLPAQVGNAGLLFDPHDAEGLSVTLERLYLDDALRSELITRGRTRVDALSWRRTARHFRALYRKVGGRSLGAEDLAILEAAPDM